MAGSVAPSVSFLPWLPYFQRARCKVREAAQSIDKDHATQATRKHVGLARCRCLKGHQKIWRIAPAFGQARLLGTSAAPASVVRVQRPSQFQRPTNSALTSAVAWSSARAERACSARTCGGPSVAVCPLPTAAALSGPLEAPQAL